MKADGTCGECGTGPGSVNGCARCALDGSRVKCMKCARGKMPRMAPNGDFSCVDCAAGCDVCEGPGPRDCIKALPGYNILMHPRQNTKVLVECAHA